MNPGRAIRLLLIAAAAIVVAATGGVEALREASGVSLRDRARSPVEGDDAKIARALREDAPIYFALRDRVTPDSLVVLFVKNWTGNPDKNVLRRVTLRQFQLRTLLHPTTVSTAFGNVGDAADVDAYLARFPPDAYVVNLTPEVALPAQERFEPLAADDRFTIFRIEGGSGARRRTGGR